MKKLIFLACLFLVITMPTHSHAVDMSTFSCADFSNVDDNTKYQYVQWLDGYMSADANATITDSEWIVHLYQHLTTSCSRQKSAILLDVANQVPYLDFEGEDKFNMDCTEIIA